MPDLAKKRRLTLYLRLITILGVVVPQKLRADWRQEWEAELQYREMQLSQWDRLDWQSKLDLLWRSLGAFWDALKLQPRRLEDEMFQDLRYGVRMLLKHKGFTAVAVLTLALGIGANTALFSVINAVLLRPLPYEEPGQLVKLWSDNSGQRTEQNDFAPAEISDFRDSVTVFEDIGLFDIGGSLNITGGVKPERLNSAEASPGLFTALRVKPIIGRTFLPEETEIGQSKVAIISERLWRHRFNADVNLAGQTIQLDGNSFTVVGVVPTDFKVPENVDIWVPFSFTAADWKNDRAHYYVEAVGRLKPGITLAQGKADLEMTLQQLRGNFPEARKNWGITILPLQEHIVGKISSALWILFGAVGFVLLIACVNVANLLFMRAAGRQKEISIRIALGAGKLRLVRQLLTESLLLATLGGGTGILLALGTIKVFSVSILNSLPRADEIRIDGWVLLFTLALSLVAGFIFGLIPALQASNASLNETLKQGGRHASGSARGRLRTFLVISEVALSLILLVGAGLLIKSFVRLQSVPPGFDPDHMLTMQLTLPKTQYADTEKQNEFVRQALQRIETLPGVKSATATINLPLVGTWSMGYAVEGHTNAPRQIADNASISLNYFQTMAIPILQGRDFSEFDTKNSTPVLIISEAFARKHFPDENPIGQQIRVGGAKREVIGVVGDVRPRGLEIDIKPQVYFPYAQKPVPAPFLTLAIRTEQEPLALAGAVEQKIQDIDKDLPLASIRTMEQILSESLAQRRLTMLLLGVFAVTAVVLAAIGIYGVLSYAVTQQTHEIGVRMALGAQRYDVLAMVMRQGMKQVLLGITVGLLGAIWLTGILKGLLFGVQATDPLTFISVAALLITVALLACYIPARRATRVNPLTALRHE